MDHHKPEPTTPPQSPPAGGLTERMRLTLRGAPLTASIPGGALAVLLVAAVAFGAAAMPAAFGAGDRGPAQAAIAGPDGGDQPTDKVEPTERAAPTDQAGPTDAAEPTDGPGATDKVEPTDKPEPRPEPTEPPAPKPDPALALTLAARECGVILKWSAYEGDGFAAYKIVRSLDEAVTWPLGAKDALVAAIAERATTAYEDCSAPRGVKLHYRVFAVRQSGDGYAVLAASPVRSISLPKPDPTEPTAPPAPTAMGLDVTAGPDGIALAWTACPDASGYKVVRSSSIENPTWPLNDGTVLVTSIGDAGTIHFVDAGVASGSHYFYRVYALRDGVVTGVSPARDAVAP